MFDNLDQSKLINIQSAVWAVWSDSNVAKTTNNKQTFSSEIYLNGLFIEFLPPPTNLTCLKTFWSFFINESTANQWEYKYV